MLVLPFSMKKLAAASFKSFIALPSKSYKRLDKGTFTTNYGMVTYLLETYITGDFINKMDAIILCFTQPFVVTPTKHVEAL